MRRTRAFTIVELMVVVAVIALLAAIIVPSVSRGYAMTRRTVCMNNLQRIHDAFALSAGRALRDGGAESEARTLSPYPAPMSWPAIPQDTIGDGEIYICPDDPIEDAQKDIDEAFGLLEYVNPYGRFPLNAPDSAESFYISRVGEDDRGGYTEYMLQDDRGNGQYELMDWHKWIDTDGFVRIYHDGTVWVPDRVPDTPDFSGCRGPGYPDRVNTCGDVNGIYWRGEPAFGADGMLRNHRGQYVQLEDWNPGRTNYGINSYCEQLSISSNTVLLVDYREKLIVEVDDPLEADGVLQDSARHLGQVNTLRADGSVRTNSTTQVSPLLEPQLWKPEEGDLRRSGDNPISPR